MGSWGQRAVRGHLLKQGLLLHWTHFVFWDGQLSERAAVSWRIVGPRRSSATHGDASRDR